jgi:hypothetical protein
MPKHWADVKSSRREREPSFSEMRRQLGADLGGKRDPNQTFTVTHVVPEPPTVTILDEEGSID